MRLYFIAFGAGLLSFFSPCILPLLPVYISFITGLSVDELKKSGVGHGRLKNVVLRILVFILGFSLIFVLLGASATVAGSFLANNKQLIRIIGGVIIILFGLQVSGIIKLRFLEYEKRMDISKRPSGILGPLAIGIMFGFGWTPCVGPILASILTIAATKGHIVQGVVLLSLYSLGLGIPFLVTGLFLDLFLAKFTSVTKYLPRISFFSGLLLIVIGILMILGLIF